MRSLVPPHLSKMDEFSDKQKLEWLTTLVPSRERAIVYTDPKHSRPVPKYRVTSLQPRIYQPSLGNLDKLPPELLYMVLSHLTCDGIEALGSCSTGGRMAVLACSQYYALLEHAPTILAILKETGLARSFTITEIYDTFTSSLCTTCGLFGRYVFLLSFTRCCLHCAETELKFLPISRVRARIEFGVKGRRTFNSLPQFNSIEGYYSSFQGKPKYYTQGLTLYSRELVEKFRDPNHTPARAQYSQAHVGDTSVKTHQRYMALTPLACFIPKSASLERGRYCAGCDRRAREHCYRGFTHSSEHFGFNPRLGHITDGCQVTCWPKRDQCVLLTERDRLHDSRHILSHLEGCVAAQTLLKLKWICLGLGLGEKNVFSLLSTNYFTSLETIKALLRAVSLHRPYPGAPSIGPYIPNS